MYRAQNINHRDILLPPTVTCSVRYKFFSKLP